MKASGKIITFVIIGSILLFYIGFSVTCTIFDMIDNRKQVSVNGEQIKDTKTSGYIKYTITDEIPQGNGRIIVRVTSDKPGSLNVDEVKDITGAHIYNDVKQLIGSKLYFGDPNAHHNNVYEYYLVKNK